MSDSKTQKIIKPRGFLSKRRMADTPHTVTHQIRIARKSRKLKPSIYFGFLLYILRTEPDNLTMEQTIWIVNYQRKLSEAQILKAARHFNGLIQSGDRQVFHARDILEVRSSIPWIEPFKAPEAVRIGKGYSDKGALRPLHKRGRQLGEIVFWDEDIKHLLPFNYPTEGKWITADEVHSLLGENLLGLVAMQLNQTSRTQFMAIYQVELSGKRRI